MHQTDSFQPITVIQVISDLRSKFREMEVDHGENINPWNEDMRRGAIHALALAQVLIREMAENRYKGETE